MAELFTFIDGLTLWHWLGFALILLVIELMIGTYDLLWFAAAAFATAIYKSLPLPGEFGSWQAELVVFATTAVVLVGLGRTVFGGLRRRHPTSHPNLNKRTASLIGQSAHAVSDFSAGRGRVRVGDTEWSAVADGETEIQSGAALRIAAADGTVLKVEPT